MIITLLITLTVSFALLQSVVNFRLKFCFGEGLELGQRCGAVLDGVVVLVAVVVVDRGDGRLVQDGRVGCDDGLAVLTGMASTGGALDETVVTGGVLDGMVVTGGDPHGMVVAGEGQDEAIFDGDQDETTMAVDGDLT